MLNTNRISTYQETLPVMIRAFRSITRDQVTEAVQVLDAQAALWSVDQHEDYGGYLSLMVTHDASGDAFVISGTADRIATAELRDDELHHLGIYPTINEALIAIVGRKDGHRREPLNFLQE